MPSGGSGAARAAGVDTTAKAIVPTVAMMRCMASSRRTPVRSDAQTAASVPPEDRIGDLDKGGGVKLAPLAAVAQDGVLPTMGRC
jgi:hypothetical protein